MKKALLIFLFISLCMVAFAWDYGFKLGVGNSSLIGPDARYDIHYKLDLYDSGVLSNTEYVFLSSKSLNSDTAYEAGAFVDFCLWEGVENLHFQAELNWQRYAASFRFAEKALSSDNLEIMESYNDILSGSVNKRVHYLSLPLLLKLKQNMFTDKSQSFQDVSVYLGPAFSLKLDESSTSNGGINSIKDVVDMLVAQSLADADTTRHYSSRRLQNGLEKLQATKLDLVIGSSFALRDIFKIGDYPETIVIDGRLCLALNQLGSANLNNNIKFRSFLVSLGMRF